MAAPKQIRPEDKGKVRIRFMEVELEGSNETLLEGIRSITSAMPSQTVVVQKQIPAKPFRGLASNAGASEAEPASEQFEEEASEQVEDAAPESAAKESSPRARPPRSAPKIPELVETLRVDDEPVPLRTFCEQSGISAGDLKDSDKAIIVAVWLKEHRSLSEFGPNEMYTCCKFMSWPPPLDPTAPMRYLKMHKKLASTEQRGNFRLTPLGERHFRELKK